MVVVLKESSVPSDVYPKVELVNGIHQVVARRKKALLISVDYSGTRRELGNCYMDTKRMLNLITEKYGFKTDEEHLKIVSEYTDWGIETETDFPAYENVMNGLHWLLEGAQPGDSLFFHYSGHGDQVEAKKAGEDDGKDEVILPWDADQSGVIKDDTLYQVLVAGLPKGALLTAVFDNCHAGTVLDLPHTTDQSVDKARKDVRKIEFRRSGNNPDGPGGLAISFSACRDAETSVMLNVDGEHQSAASLVLDARLRESKKWTYAELLKTTHEGVRELHELIDQTAVLSANYAIDLSRPFAL